jgi:DNA-binding transcriptional LysR family regulator
MLDALISFLAVADSGSFSRVAQRDGVAVSSVTRKIDWLEAEVGTRLFSRSSRRVLLTDAGEQFLPRARNILAELAEAKEALANLQVDPRGEMVITAPATFGRRVIVPAVARFLERYPLMEVSLHVSDQFVDLAEQRVDVAIRIGALPDSDLLTTRLAPMKLVVCASPSYLEKHGRPASPAQLISHQCIDAATRGLPGSMWCFDGVNHDKPLAVRGPLRTDDKECMLQAALDGVGVVHVASWLVSDDVKAGRLVALFPRSKQPITRGPERAIHAVRMQGRSHEAKAKLFIAHLRETFGDVPPWDRR